MENINRIEIQGPIGSLRISDIQGSTLVRCSVATNHIFKGRDGYAVVETTWHDVNYFKKPDDSLDLEKLGKGVVIHASGRIRNIRYTASDGTERQANQVIAEELTIVEER